MNQKDLLKSNYAAILEHGQDARLFNFRNHSMQSYASAKTPFEASAFLPSDELYLGLFEDYRAKGLNNFDALKRVYQFELGEPPAQATHNER